MDYKSIFRALPHNYFIIDVDPPKFTILDGSDNHFQSLDRTREELVGNGIFEMFPDNQSNNYQNAKQLRESFMFVITNLQLHRLTARYDVPIRGTSQFDFRFWTIQNYPYIENGKLKYIINTATDVTSVFRLVEAQANPSQLINNDPTTK